MTNEANLNELIGEARRLAHETIEQAHETAVINAETHAKQKVIDAQAQADKRHIEGYTYQQERGFDVEEKVAQNEAVGEFIMSHRLDALPRNPSRTSFNSGTSWGILFGLTIAVPFSCLFWRNDILGHAMVFFLVLFIHHGLRRDPRRRKRMHLKQKLLLCKAKLRKSSKALIPKCFRFEKR